MGRLLAVTAVAFSLGCGPTNLGEACDGMAQTFCDRLFECTRDSDDRSDCLRTLYSRCCTGIVCTEPVPDQAQVAACRSELRTHSCTLIAQSVFPTVCIGALAPPPPRIGGVCAIEDQLGCAEQNDKELRCRAGKWELLLECRGPAGCSQSETVVTCDSSGNTRGDRCPPESEGKERCDPATPTDILRCRSGRLEGVLSCPAPSRCTLSGNIYTCG